MKNDGFSTGEVFIWKIWDINTGEKYEAFAIYDTGFQDTGYFAENGTNKVISLNTNSFQEIDLHSNWNIFSTYIIPSQPDIADVLAHVISDVIIAKNKYGEAFWPLFNVEMIDFLQPGKGRAFLYFHETYVTLVVQFGHICGNSFFGRRYFITEFFCQDNTYLAYSIFTINCQPCCRTQFIKYYPVK